MHDPSQPTWGIVGGLGPLASAEFVRTIYESCAREREQDHPRIMLLSDPEFPDRTASLARGDIAPLVDRLERNLEALIAFGATRVVVCCMTIHAVFPALPQALRARVLSLVDLVIDRLASVREQHLMLCTSGCRAAGVLQAHPGWPAVRDRIVWPDAADQERVHAMIYTLKRGGGAREQTAHVRGWIDKYGVRAYVAGCTELHLLTRSLAEPPIWPHGNICVDPLMLAASEVAGSFAPRPAAAPHGAAPDVEPGASETGWSR